MKHLIKKLLRESLTETNFNNLLGEVTSSLDFNGFKVNETLNPKVWESESKMHKDVLEALKTIAIDYWNSLELDVPLIDITLTGSLANFNWSKYSDADLHIILDDKLLGDDSVMIKDLLDIKTRAWNLKHDITVKGFDVELYLQPKDQPHHSTGIYSLINNDWVIKPNMVEADLDKDTITKKYNSITKSVAEIKKTMSNGDYEDVIHMLEKLKNKIKVMRQSGLETGGEFSVENIAFKLLRRNDVMEEINDMLTDAYDSSVTIEGFGGSIYESALDEDYPKGFDLNKFKTLTSWAAKQRYAQEQLGKPIGRGSSRIVYKVDEGKVLKLAKNAKGLLQNEVEIDISSTEYYPDILAQVFDYDKEGHLWVEMELARRAKKSDFKSVYGINFEDMGMHLRNYEALSNGKRKIFGIDPEVEEAMYENEFVSELQNFMADTNSLSGDIAAIGSWGMVKRDGIFKPVLIDFGITNAIYQDYYM
jgi:hypothetical protein